MGPNIKDSLEPLEPDDCCFYQGLIHNRRISQRKLFLTFIMLMAITVAFVLLFQLNGRIDNGPADKLTTYSGVFFLLLLAFIFWCEWIYHNLSEEFSDRCELAKAINTQIEVWRTEARKEPNPAVATELWDLIEEQRALIKINNVYCRTKGLNPDREIFKPIYKILESWNRKQEFEHG